MHKKNDFPITEEAVKTYLGVYKLLISYYCSKIVIAVPWQTFEV